MDGRLSVALHTDTHTHTLSHTHTYTHTHTQRGVAVCKGGEGRKLQLTLLDVAVTVAGGKDKGLLLTLLL